jgi:hypothetical protein
MQPLHSINEYFSAKATLEKMVFQSLYQDSNNDEELDELRIRIKNYENGILLKVHQQTKINSTYRGLHKDI